MMFPDGFDAFWALWTSIWVFGHPLNPSSLLWGWGGLALFGGFGVKKGFRMYFGVL